MDMRYRTITNKTIYMNAESTLNLIFLHRPLILRLILSNMNDIKISVIKLF